MSFKDRFRDNIESLGKRSIMSLGQPVSKHLNPTQLHRDSPLSPLPSAPIPFRVQRDAGHLHASPSYVPSRSDLIPDSVIAYSGIKDDHRNVSIISMKEKKQRRSAKAWRSQLVSEEHIPMQLLASHSMSNETPVDFACLDGSPFVYRGKEGRKRGDSRGAYWSPGVRRSLDQVSHSASRYVPCRVGGLGPAHVGSSHWERALSLERRRKEYGSLLRVGWQLKAQRHSSNIFQVSHSHPRSYSDDFDK